MKKLLILLVLIGVALVAGGLAWWGYLVSVCSGRFSLNEATLNYCLGYFTTTQLVNGGLANIVPLLVEIVIVIGSVLMVVGIVLLAGAYVTRKK